MLLIGFIKEKENRIKKCFMCLWHFYDTSASGTLVPPVLRPIRQGSERSIPLIAFRTAVTKEVTHFVTKHCCQLYRRCILISVVNSILVLSD